VLRSHRLFKYNTSWQPHERACQASNSRGATTDQEMHMQTRLAHENLACMNKRGLSVQQTTLFNQHAPTAWQLKACC
jgi:hypothetical protein